jgi:hypothetical protein
MSSLYPKGFKYATMNDILKLKLKELNSISPKSIDVQKSPNSFNSINFNSNLNNNSKNNSKNNSSKNQYHVNIKSSQNMINNSNTQSAGNGTNIMRMIRGGGGKDSNPSAFFSKVISNDFQMKPQRMSLIKASGKKVNADFILKEQYENERKALDFDDLNKSQESDLIIDPEAIDKLKTPQKNKKGIWNLFTKIISK